MQERCSYLRLKDTTALKFIQPLEKFLIWFFRALDDRRSLFREFRVLSPYISTKDIFALRDSRVVNAYRKISLKKMDIAVPNVPLRQRVDLRIVPDIKTGISEIRFWHNRKLAGTASARNEDLNIQNF